MSMLDNLHLRGTPPARIPVAYPSHLPESDRPMSEYESALCGMVRVMLDTLIEMGAPRHQLVKELKSLKDSEQLAGRRAGAATIEITMRTVGLR